MASVDGSESGKSSTGGTEVSRKLFSLKSLFGMGQKKAKEYDYESWERDKYLKEVADGQAVMSPFTRAIHSLHYGEHVGNPDRIVPLPKAIDVKMNEILAKRDALESQKLKKVYKFGEYKNVIKQINELDKEMENIIKRNGGKKTKDYLYTYMMKASKYSNDRRNFFRYHRPTSIKELL